MGLFLWHVWCLYMVIYAQKTTFRNKSINDEGPSDFKFDFGNYPDDVDGDWIDDRRVKSSYNSDQ